MFDYHLHSQFSPDSTMNLIQICDKAISMGLNEIAITDHMEVPHPSTNLNISAYSFNYESYISTIQNIKSIYKGKLNIKIGVELGAHADNVEGLNIYIKDKDYDFIILSEHYTRGYDVENEEGFFSKYTKQQAYLKYLDDLEEIIDGVNNYCILGHLDFIARYATYKSKAMEYNEFKESIDRILYKVIRSGKGIEVNTSGYRLGLDSIMPNREILKRYMELGGEILTVGSDAHFVEHIGCKFSDAIDIIKGVGFKYLTVFDECKPKFIRI